MGVDTTRGSSSRRAGAPDDESRDYGTISAYLPDPDAPTFTERDLEVYRSWNELVDSGAIDLATSRSLLRANSHLADRLSLWQFEALVEDAVRRFDLDDTTARIYVLDHMRERVGAFEQMFVHSWRRQMESLLARLDKEVSQRGRQVSKDRFPLNLRSASWTWCPTPPPRRSSGERSSSSSSASKMNRARRSPKPAVGW